LLIEGERKMTAQLEAVRKEYIAAWLRWSWLEDEAEMSSMSDVKSWFTDKAVAARAEARYCRGRWSALFGAFLGRVSG